MSKQPSLREKISEYANKKYKSAPEHLWMRFPNYAVFRHEDNRKWYGIIMDVPGGKLGLPGEDRVDILNVKLGDEFLTELLIQQPGYMRGYHISRGNWISIMLDGTVPIDEICQWIDKSYIVTSSKQKKQKIRPPKEWIIPANPKYYDIEHAFDYKDETDWKQGSGIKVGDTVFLYVAAPVSAILHKCKVTKTDIPFDYRENNLTISLK